MEDPSNAPYRYSLYVPSAVWDHWEDKLDRTDDNFRSSNISHWDRLSFRLGPRNGKRAYTDDLSSPACTLQIPLIGHCLLTLHTVLRFLGDSILVGF